jgi:hypothetical protein
MTNAHRALSAAKPSRANNAVVPNRPHVRRQVAPRQAYTGTPGRGSDALGREHGVVKHKNVHPPRRADDPRKPGGRTKFTEEQLAAALRLSCGIHAEACRILLSAYGRTVAVSTFGRLVASSPRLQSAKNQAIELMLDYAELALFRKIEAGETDSIIFFLRFKGAGRGYTAPSR